MYREDFWKEVFQVHGSVTPFVMVRVMVFGLFSVAVYWVAHLTGMHTGLAVAPYEIVGVILALLLVLRTNAGYDRWYEARKLWGGIVNQSRISPRSVPCMAPKTPAGKRTSPVGPPRFRTLAGTACGAKPILTISKNLLGKDRAAELAAAPHKPMYVAGRLAQLLNEAVLAGQLDRFAFMQAEHERASLIDHIGACERIVRTPLAQVFSIKIRRFLFVYLTALPIAIVDKTGILTPLIVLVVAYPLLSLDQIGIELQNPFSRERLSHLPLDEISSNIERNVFDTLQYMNGPRTERLAGNAKVECLAGVTQYANAAE